MFDDRGFPRTFARPFTPNELISSNWGVGGSSLM